METKFEKINLESSDALDVIIPKLHENTKTF